MIETITERIDQQPRDINAVINERAMAQMTRTGAARKGDRTGWDSPEARATRKGWHDVRSGRMTPEAFAVAPTQEAYTGAWRTRGLMEPKREATEYALEPSTPVTPGEA